jgi:hypothetical protein
MRPGSRRSLAVVVGVALGCSDARPVEGYVLDVRAVDTVARLRPNGALERQMIAEGLCGSATFRSLADAIQRSDVIVYVSMRPMRDRHVNGHLEFMAATATDRLLRAVIAFPLDRVARIAALGHELQHAVDVASDARIRSGQAFAEYFSAHGRPSSAGMGYETDAARRAELQIRVDLARPPSCRPGS